MSEYVRRVQERFNSVLNRTSPDVRTYDTHVIVLVCVLVVLCVAGIGVGIGFLVARSPT